MKRFITFAIGGPLRGYYMELESETEGDIRAWMAEHFPKDWAFSYTEEEWSQTEQVKRFDLQLLRTGAIENYNGKYFFHEGKTLAQIS